jgi:hypothetical protein
MAIDSPSERILVMLLDAEVELIVVGGLAAVLQGAPIGSVMAIDASRRARCRDC